MFYFDHEHTAENQNNPCQYMMTNRSPQYDGAGNLLPMTQYVCNASWTSSLHPPDQYRHWCAALEAGGDCIHEEGF